MNNDQQQLNGSSAVEEFVRIMTAISREEDLGGVLASVLSAAMSLTRAQGGLVHLLDSSKRFLAVETARFGGQNATSAFGQLPLYVDGSRNMSNPFTYTAFVAAHQVFDDISSYTGFDWSCFRRFDQRHQHNTRSVATFPLRNHKEITVGVLTLVNPITDDGVSSGFDQDQVDIARAFASQAAVAIDNVQLVNKNRQLIDALNSTNRQLAAENRELKASIQSNYDFSRIIGKSRAMQTVFELLEKVIDSDATVLIRGETGTGKEMIAQTLHYNSRRKDKAFVAQNCAALPENLLESELFGYVKGAFSGADRDKKGLIEVAHGGTLFLDEIGDMPMNLQVKLLRVLQDKEIRPLGSEQARKINVRFVAATHCDLKEKIESGEFREDLYYRLNVFPIEMPPLRDRREDIPQLLKHFLDGLSDEYNKEIAGVSPAAINLLQSYDYPGNVRDLKNIIERSILMCEQGGHIMPEHLPDEVVIQDAEKVPEMQAIPIEEPLREIIESYEARVLEKKLEACGWNQSQAARELKIGRRTLIDKIKRYGVNKYPPGHTV